MTRFILVRHGETDWNKEHRVQGHADAPLNGDGIAQAKSIATRLSDINVDAIFSSDVSRTRETAAIIAAGRGIEVQEMFDLRERNYGKWEGVTQAEWESTDPEGFAHWKRAPETYVPPGGESLQQVHERTVQAYNYISQNQPSDSTVVVVGHGAALLVLTVHLLQLPLKARNNFNLSNTSLSVLDVGQDFTVIRLWNDVSHRGISIP